MLILREKSTRRFRNVLVRKDAARARRWFGAHLEYAPEASTRHHPGSGAQLFYNNLVRA